MDVVGGGARPDRAYTAGGPPAEERYKALVRNFPKSAVILYDRDLRFVLVDGPEVGTAGYSKEKMEGHTLHEVFPPEFVAMFEGNMRRVLRGEQFSAELPFGELWYEYSYVPVRDDEGNILYGMILAANVSERHAMEDALRRSEERFARIFHSSPDALTVARADSGAFVETNQAFLRTFGWTREEVLGKTALELGLWVEPHKRADVIAMLGERGMVEDLQLPFRRKDGSILEGVVSLTNIEIDGEPCVFFVFRDQTERILARRDLESSEARLRSLSEATFEGIAITHNGRVVDVNDQFAAMFRSTRERFVGRLVTDFVAPESIELVRERMAEGNAGAYEHLAIREDGTVFPVEVRARRAVMGGMSVRVSAVRDITRRKHDEAEREKLIAELRARNSEMEQFAYTVSHDLKSPLVTINGFLGVLRRDIEEGDNERVASDISRIGSAATKMMRLLNDVLELSRAGRAAETVQRVSLQEVVKEAVELVSFAVSARGVEVAVEEALPVVFGSRISLLQVMQNLLENALKYMGNQPHPRIEVGQRRDPRHSVLFVRDNGIGIDPVHAERIFGLFEKLDPKSEGTGLGLALVRRILEYHGGKVAVESNGVAGSTFVLYFPKESSPPAKRETR